MNVKSQSELDIGGRETCLITDHSCNTQNCQFFKKYLKHPLGLTLKKLSRESSPCEPSEDYDFNSCVINGIVKNLGCKPFWILKNPNRLTNCTEAKDLTRYLHELKSTGHMDEKSLLDRYSCLKPCSYMEYKVIDEDEDCNILLFKALYPFYIYTFFSFFLRRGSISANSAAMLAKASHNTGGVLRALSIWFW